jgi:glycerol-3-phosphate acyltransferase PlsY
MSIDHRSKRALQHGNADPSPGLCGANSFGKGPMNISDILVTAALPAFAYALGSVPWGLVLTRAFTSVDIRRTGSGNIGATNVRRTAGTLLGLLTLTLDALKGYLPAALAACLTGRTGSWNDLYVAVVALAAFLGHLYPLYTRGRNGGKGVATAGGCALALSPPAAGWAVLGFLMLVVATRRVSAGSLAAAAILPAALWKATGSSVFTAAGGFMAAGIILRHRDNIRRLLSGREPRL